MSENRPGRDPETGAALYRILRAAPALAAALEALSPEAGARIGVTPEDRERVMMIFSRAVTVAQELAEEEKR